MLETMITLPSRRSAMPGMTRLVSQSTLRRFTVIVLSQSTSLALAIGPMCGAIPALQTRMSMRPCRSSVARTRSSSSRRYATSQGIPVTAWPSRLISRSRRSRSRSASLLEITTFAPAIANSLGDRTADAARRAGDERDPAGQVEQ